MYIDDIIIVCLVLIALLGFGFEDFKVKLYYDYCRLSYIVDYRFSTGAFGLRSFVYLLFVVCNCAVCIFAFTSAIITGRCFICRYERHRELIRH